MALPARTVLVTRLTSASSRKRLDRPGNELLNAFGGQPGFNAVTIASRTVTVGSS